MQTSLNVKLQHFNFSTFCDGKFAYLLIYFAAYTHMEKLFPFKLSSQKLKTHVFEKGNVMKIV